MKRVYTNTKSNHIGWRPGPELKARWLAFLKSQPPINRSEFLNAMLTRYLDEVERYGLDPMTLYPRTKK